MEASNHRSCGVSFILVDTAIIVKERLNHTQCLTIQPPMLKHSQGQVPGYIPQQTGYYVTARVTHFTRLCLKAVTELNSAEPTELTEYSLF